MLCVDLHLSANCGREPAAARIGLSTRAWEHNTTRAIGANVAVMPWLRGRSHWIPRLQGRDTFNRALEDWVCHIASDALEALGRDAVEALVRESGRRVTTCAREEPPAE